MWFENVGTFVEFGFRHIIPDGPDHMLFVAALFLNARGWGSLLVQVTTFTLAHTITLGLASTGIVEAPGNLVEPMIALSIAVLALEAIFFNGPNIWRLPVIFAFGLFHGLGFGAQMKVYLENADLSAGLVGITVGVEVGHLSVLVVAAIIAFAAQFVLKIARKPALYHRVFVVPVAGLIALIGLYWTLQRVGLMPT
jgi:hypothetical protein